MTVVKTKIVRIGNSRGIRIPAVFLKQVAFEEDVEMEVVGQQIIVRAGTPVRAGWEAAFRAMAEAGDDQLLDPAVPTAWDESEWEW
ncbi:AbrB/MazE/SpoVT family DNA-binding domain-containing protein [bacterium]|nr:AbrB/MazE/SpoVT family DNA-binding domain-containing protein [Chloroflexi bacterium CFX6]RIL10707.1 MAG: AbrB/MazE/SpoVT family DNA-binding domain-containing protein [bacterium]